MVESWWNPLISWPSPGIFAEVGRPLHPRGLRGDLCGRGAAVSRSMAAICPAVANWGISGIPDPRSSWGTCPLKSFKLNYRLLKFRGTKISSFATTEERVLGVEKSSIVHEFVIKHPQPNLPNSLLRWPTANHVFFFFSRRAPKVHPRCIPSPIPSPSMARSLSIFEYPEMEESLTAWTSFLAPDVQRYAEGARGSEMAGIQQLLRPVLGGFPGFEKGGFPEHRWSL